MITLNKYQLKDDYNEFLQWFSGFSDAESNFSIVPIKDGSYIRRFSFVFKIGLHIDDKDVLIFIKNKLEMGNVYSNKEECIYTISKKQDLYKLIDIFDKFKLNTTKYFDYLDFKKAFTLYFERENKVTEEITDKLLIIKNCMNKNRININELNNEHVLTKYWLLGLVEGDGSFHFFRNDYLPVFSIVMTESQSFLFFKLKEFLIKEFKFNYYDKLDLENSSKITLVNQKPRNNSKGSVLLQIKNINILNNYLIPYFDNLNFLTKKSKDYKDFKILVKAIYLGGNRDEEIKSLMIKLSYSMNNYRLSTCNLKTQNLSSEERDILINITPIVEHLEDGRLKDISSNKIIHQADSSIYEIFNSKGEILIAFSLKEASCIIGVNIKTLSKKLDSSINKLVELKTFKIRRIGVYKKVN